MAVIGWASANFKIMSNVKKLMITRYDSTIKEPPYLTIQIDKMLFEQPETDNLGEEFCERIRQGCQARGYQFKFYTLSDAPDFDYEVVVK
jgi:hypothetical protein